MSEVIAFVKYRCRKAVERDRRAEASIEAISRSLWRWRERRLALLVGVMALLDFATTSMALQLSGKTYVYEGGLLAGWALRVGGLGWLFLIDMAAVAALALTAFAARAFCLRFGFDGFGRAAFVALLVPYVVVAAAAVVNNLILTFA
jgi:hypothetical protein